MSGDGSHFYKALAPLPSFESALDPANLTPLPADWWFFSTDLEDSTGWIAQGHYRQVNLAAAAAITAVLNAIGRKPIPYIFGGDGAHIAVHQDDAATTRQALLAVARTVRNLHGMHLRVAGVPHSTLQQAGVSLSIARIMLSHDVDQAVFGGDAVAWLDHHMRHDPTHDAARQEQDDLPEPDLTGLECRWKEMPGRQPEIVNLLVQITPGGTAADSIFRYKTLLQWIDDAFGPTAQRHPLAPHNLALMTTPSELSNEVGMHHPHAKPWQRYALAAWRAVETRIGSLLMSRGLKFLGVDWAEYKRGVLSLGDYQKFNGLLALTSSTTDEKRKQLEDRLTTAWQRGELTFGMHITDRVLLTCMVLERNKYHRHFVDGADGGYAMAARDFKNRMTSGSLCRNNE